MKLTSVLPPDQPNKKGLSAAENREARVERMKKFWIDNPTVYMVGKVLAHVEAGKTLADHMLAGEEIELSSVGPINGRLLPLSPGYKLSIATTKTVWGCPACHSAHGTGVGVSPKADLTLLENNKFFYNPETKALFTISTNCWSEYVKALGAAKSTRFQEVPKVEVEVLPAEQSTKKPARQIRSGQKQISAA